MQERQEQDIKTLYSNLTKEEMELQVQIRGLQAKTESTQKQLSAVMEEYSESVDARVKELYTRLNLLTEGNERWSEEKIQEVKEFLIDINTIKSQLLDEEKAIQDKLNQLMGSSDKGAV